MIQSDELHIGYEIRIFSWFLDCNDSDFSRLWNLIANITVGEADIQVCELWDG